MKGTPRRQPAKPTSAPTTGPFSQFLTHLAERPYSLTLTLARNDQVGLLRLSWTSYPPLRGRSRPHCNHSLPTHQRRFERQQGTLQAAIAAHQLPTTVRSPGSVNGPCVRTRATGHIAPGTVTTQTSRPVFLQWLFGAYRLRLVTIRHPICTVHCADLDLIALPSPPTSTSSPTQAS